MSRLGALAALLLAAAPGPDAIFSQPWTWTDARGAAVRLDALRGSPVVITVGFARCQVRCPHTVAKLRELERALLDRGVHAQFVFVSLDPSDTPERLRAFQAEHQLPEASWHLLRGPVDQTRALARALGIRELEDQGHLDHQAKSVAFDAQGRRLTTLEGWHFDLAAAAAQLSGAPAPGSAASP